MDDEDFGLLSPEQIAAERKRQKEAKAGELGLTGKDEKTRVDIDDFSLLAPTRQEASETRIQSGIQSTINPEEFEPYMDEVRLEDSYEELRRSRAENQSAWEQFGGFLNQALIGEVAGGTISAIGSLFEIPSLIYEGFSGETSDFNNFLVQLGDDVRQWTQKTTPIYQENPEQSFDVMDFAWWNQNAVSVASAASMLISAKGVMKGMSWVNKLATGVGKTVGGKVGAALQAGNNMSLTAKALTQQTASALMMRHAENTREAFGVVNDVKRKSMNKFDNEEEWEKAQNSDIAKELENQGKEVTKKNLSEYIASKAGWRTYSINFANIAFDFIQAGALLKGNAFTRSTVADKAVKSKLGMKDPTAFQQAYNKLGRWAGWGTEGLEEAINYIGEKEGKVLGDLLTGEEKQPLSERLATYISDPKMWEAAAWGAAGGLVFDKLGSVMSGNTDAEVAKMQLATIAHREAETTRYMKTLKDIQSQVANKQMTIEAAKDATARAKSRLALSVGLEAAKRGSTNIVLEQLQNGQFKEAMLSSMTTEELQEIGVTDIDKAIGHTIKDVKLTEMLYNNSFNKVMSAPIKDSRKFDLLNEVIGHKFEYEKNSVLKEKKTNLVNDLWKQYDDTLKTNPNSKLVTEKRMYSNYIGEVNKVLEMAKKQNDSVAVAEFEAKKQIAQKRLTELDTLLKDVNSVEIPIEKNLEEALATQTILEVATKYSNQRINELETDKGIKAFDKLRKGFEDKRDARISEMRKKNFENQIDNLASGKDIEINIKNLEAELIGKDQKSDEFKYIQKKLKEAKAKKEFLEKQGKLKKEVENETENQDTDDTQIVFDNYVDSDEGFAALDKELGGNGKGDEALDLEERLIAVEDDPALSIEQKIKKLQKRRDAAKHKNKPLRRAFINNIIYSLQARQRTDLGQESKGYKVGNTYTYQNIDYTVTGIYRDGNNNEFAQVEADGKAALFPLSQFESLLSTGVVVEKVNEQLDNPKDVLIGSFINEQNKSIVMEDLISQVSVPTDLFNLLSNLPGIKVQVATDLADPAKYDWETNTVLVNESALENATVADFTDLLAHELVHATLHEAMPYWKDGKVPSSRSNFNSILRDLIDKLVSTKEKQANSIVSIIKESKKEHPEELITYALTDQDFFNELKLNQPEVLEGIRFALKDINNLIEMFNVREAVSLKPSAPSIKITPQARNLANERNIDISKINGTGQNGRITIKDVVDYSEENNIKLPEQLPIIQIEIQVLQAANSNNIYTSFINDGIKDGRVDVEYYKQQLEKYNIYPEISQKELENSIREILSPTTTVGSQVELRLTDDGKGIAVYHNNTAIGFINNVDTLQRDFDFATKVHNTNSVKLLEQLNDSTSNGKYKQYVNRKILELEGVSKSKPFANHLAILKNQLETAKQINDSVSKIWSKNPSAKITTTITRKTSGNLNRVEEFAPIKNEMPHINEVFYVDAGQQSVGKATRLISNKDPKKVFNRSKHADDYMNYDKSYTSGRIYMMVAGANVNPALLNTHIPVPLQQSNLSETTANEVFDLIEELISKLHSLEGKHWKDVMNNESVRESINSIKEFLIVVKSNSKASDYVKVFNDRIEFNFGEGYTASIYLYDGIKGKPVKNLIIQDITGKNVLFTVNGRNQKALNGMTKKALYKKALVKAFTQKRHNVDLSLIKSTDSYKGYNSYLDYLIQSDVLTTDIRMLKNSKGNTMTDKLGNPLPAVTTKSTTKSRNSNLVISIDVNSLNLASIGGKNQSNTQSGTNTKESQESPKKAQNKATLIKDTESNIESAIELLLKNKQILVENEDIADNIILSQTLNNELQGNEIILDEVQEDGTVKLTISVDNSGISRNKLASTNVDGKLATEDIEAVKIWWNKTFGNNIPLDTNVTGIIFNQGQEAWGVFSDAMVRLSKDAPKGTSYHEAFHVVFWLYLDENQRANILQEAKNKYGDTTNLALEEILADEFADYMLKKGNTKKVDGKIKQLFAKLWNWLTNFFNKGNSVNIDNLFKDIDSGKFNYKPDQQSIDYAKGVTRNKVVEGFTRQDEHEVITLLAKKIIEFQQNNQNITIADMKVDPTLNVKDNVKRSLQMDRRLVASENTDKARNIQRVLRKYDEFFDKTTKYVKRQFGVEIFEKSINESLERIDKKWDDRSIFSVSQKDSVSNYIKSMIMTTPMYSEPGVIQKDTFLGLETFLDFNKVYPYIQRNMMGALDIDEMLARMETLAEHDPSLLELVHRINNDDNLKAAWISQFKKQSPDKDVVLYGQEGIKVDSANKNTSHYILADKWENKLTTIINEKGLENINSSELQNSFENIYNDNTYSVEGDSNKEFVQNKEIIIEKTVEILSDIGVDVSSEQINKIIENKTNREYYGTPKDVFDSIFYDGLTAILNDITSQKNNKIEAFKLDAINRLNVIAMHVNTYQYDLIESSYFDVNGNNVYATLNPHYMSDFFDKIKAATNVKYNNRIQAKEDLLESLKQYAQDPAMLYSNWLWAEDGLNGALLIPDTGKVVNDLTIEHLNLPFLERWNYSMLDGVKNTDSKEGFQYSDMPDNSWEIAQVIMFAETGKIPVVIPSDSGNISFIQANTFKGAENGQVNNTKIIRRAGTPTRVDNSLYRAVANTVYQEIERMKAARDLMFIYNAEEGTWNPKPHKFIGAPDFDPDVHLDYTKLEKNYYWKKQKMNTEAGISLPVIATQDSDGNWNPTGSVFKFNNIPTVNDIKDITHNGLTFLDLWNTQSTRNEIGKQIRTKIDEFIAQQIQEGIQIFEHTKPVLEQSPNYTNWNSFRDFIAEFMLNSYISNVEQFNFLVGNQIEYKAKGVEKYAASDINKRAKQVSAPGVNTAGVFTKPFYRAVTIKDIEAKSEYYDMIANSVADSLKNSNTKYQGMDINLEELDKSDPDFSKMNALDKQVYKIISGYLYTNVADAQGYVSVDRAERLIKDLGRWNDVYENLFDKVRQGVALKSDELDLMLQPFKGFYYGRDYNSYLNRHVSNQVKYSTTVLIPQLVKGTQLEQLVNWMDKENLDEVQFESAEKVGTEYVMDITDGNGNISQSALETFSEDNGYRFRSYNNDNWRVQLDVPDHMIDSQNKLGTQIAKIIISNLGVNNVYKVAGTEYTRDEFIAHYMDLMSTNIQEDADKLLNELGVVNKDGEFVFDKGKKQISELLKAEVEKRGISDNYIQAIELDSNGEFNMPLFISSMGKKWESILSSLFTNNVIDQKIPGASAVLLSDAFIKPVEGVSVDTNIEGIKWSKEVKDRGDYKLRMSRDTANGVIYAEALMPAWSKKFFKADGTLDDIDNIPTELKEMISYRIPTEADYSATVFTVVGFLPDANGSTIVLPEEYVTAKGFDFDVDKEFIMYKHFDMTNISGQNVYSTIDYLEAKDELAFISYILSSDQKRTVRELKDNPTRVLKNMETQIKRFETRAENIYNQRTVLYESIKAKENAYISNYNESTGENFTTLKQISEDVSTRFVEASEILSFVESEYERAHHGKNTEYDLQLQGMQQDAKIIMTNAQEEHSIIKSLREELNEEYDEIAELKTSNARQEKLKNQYIKSRDDEYIRLLREEFNSKSLTQINSREARDNRIIDIFKSKLSHKAHFGSVITPQSFEDGANVIKEINDVTNEKGSGLNPATTKAQLMFRKQNIAGRALKGMAANSNAFLTIAQVAKMKLRKDLGFYVKYKTELSNKDLAKNEKLISDGKIDQVIKAYNVQELQTKYGVDNVTISNGEAIVLHDKFAWNADDSFTNVDGEMTTVHASQLLAMILDIVKEGIPFNVNTYTFSSYITMLNTGINIRHASMFIRQPILKSLSDTFFETQGFVEDERTGKEIELTKRDFVTKAYIEMRRLGKNPFNPKLTRRLEDKIKQGENINLSKDQIKQAFGVDFESNYAFTTEELKDNISNESLKDLNSAQKLEYYTNQLKVLEMFKRYKKTGEAYDDIINAMSTDRRGVGPSLSVPENMNRQITQATYYFRDTEVGTALRKYDNAYGVTGLNELQDRVKSGEYKLNDFVRLEEGARILVEVNGEDIPATMAVYPKMFGLTHESVYPVLQSYKEHGFDKSIAVFAPLFFKETAGVKKAIQEILYKAGLMYNSTNVDKVADYLLGYVQKDFNWFKQFDDMRVLGIDTIVNISDNLSIEEYKQLSAANKVLYMQNKLKDSLVDDTHILNYLKPKTSQEKIERNTMQVIDFVNTKTDTLTDDALVDSFQEMWDSGDEFQRNLAEDLIVYSYLTTGFNMRKNSFAKLIPTQIFESIGYNSYLYEILNAANNQSYFDNKLEDIMDKFLRSSWRDSKIVPYVYTKYKKGGRGATINKTPIWKPDYKTGILQVSLDGLLNESSKVRRAEYITVPLTKIVMKGNKRVTMKYKDVLYKQYAQKDGQVYYVPVDKLGNQNIIEYGDRSNIQSNRIAQDPYKYEMTVDLGKPVSAADVNVKYNSYSSVVGNLGINQADSQMFINATAYIGVGVKGELSYRYMNAFEDLSNKSEYTAEDKVMVSAMRPSQGMTAEKIKDYMFENTRLKGTYTKIYDALSAGSTIMIRSNKDSEGNKIPTYGGGMYGNDLLLQHLDSYVNQEQLYKQIDKGVAYYSKLPFGNEILTNEELDSIDNNNYNPDGNCN